MDYTRIQIDSIGIGLSNIYNLDLTRDNFIKTYLAVGEYYNDNHDITLDTNNFGLNTLSYDLYKTEQIKDNIFLHSIKI